MAAGTASPKKAAGLPSFPAGFVLGKAACCGKCQKAQKEDHPTANQGPSSFQTIQIINKSSDFSASFLSSLYYIFSIKSSKSSVFFFCATLPKNKSALLLYCTKFVTFSLKKGPKRHFRNILSFPSPAPLCPGKNAPETPRRRQTCFLCSIPNTRPPASNKGMGR